MVQPGVILSEALRDRIAESAINIKLIVKIQHQECLE